MAQQCSPGVPAAGSVRIFGFLLLASLATAGVGIPGGLQDVPVTDTGVQQAAQFAVASYNRASNSLYYYRSVKIQKAQSQVVSGMKYYITVELANTVCAKRGDAGLSHEELNSCALASGDKQQRQICDFQIWSRPWLNDVQVVSMNCHPV